jgi:ligand-binding sensor domain-containing protein
LYSSKEITIVAQEIQFNQFTAKDGLSNNAVYCVLQDHLGFLWFGTEDGLNRYDLDICHLKFQIYWKKSETLNNLKRSKCYEIYQ